MSLHLCIRACPIWAERSPPSGREKEEEDRGVLPGEEDIRIELAEVQAPIALALVLALAPVRK